ncbi:LytTr DNA-binding domain-containing protein [Lactobacillus bombicola]|uniref:LytTr DNA-binding domain-containing protein n=1 Tax=Lactobacillus bombicola TaxID=1505723 RepID=A0A1I1SK67_9LACO|nr:MULTISPECIES: LytTR family DNA-binding domain-containing protein [Lactobacillus]MCO6527615.1 LytTR family transcriptional regulator [Lactobacillus sp.]RMC42270.1 LytTR family transcriptional regulator [Lactobacillus sp. ESL0233]RMC46254.1 LytTR family transcriptional regulator [Lactobacillus sp. ESL0230]RMC51307.1 LytTR family transcriptional regulator [Lactobacillus sp. ESL0225]SFD46869.1 LytTr DNA-binding domain-containing protein [Lactobacillus bombicola]
MLVNQKIDPQAVDLSVTVNTPQIDNNSTTLQDNLSYFVNEQNLIGYQNGRQKVIALYDVISIHTQDKKVICETNQGNYRLKKRLYEIKSILPQRVFIQVSSSEIVNFSCIQEFALTRNGIYQIIFKNGHTTYSSRRYMQKIKKEFLS